jgi:hypothetical protein
MDGRQKGKTTRRLRAGVAAAVLGAVFGAGIILPAQHASAFSKTWHDAGCTVSGMSRGLLDGLTIGGGGKAGSFWVNPVSSANESCAYQAGASEYLDHDGVLHVRVKIDSRVRFQVAVFGTQGDIACAKPLGVITSVFNDGAFHKLSVPLLEGEWVDCVRIVLDDDPNTTPPGDEYPFALIDYIKIRDGRTTVWAENFS